MTFEEQKVSVKYVISPILVLFRTTRSILWKTN